MTFLKTFPAVAALSLLAIAGLSIPAAAQMPDFQLAQSNNKDKSNNGKGNKNNTNKQSSPTSVPEPHAAWILLPALVVVGLRERRRRRLEPARNRRQ